MPNGPRPTIYELFGAAQRKASGAELDTAAIHESARRGVATAASPLPHAETIQRAFGRHDISGIKAHTGPDARASTDAIGATAYATGDHVVLSEGTDLHTVAHEAAHVVQQRGGVQLKGGVGEVGDPYELHADEVADAVVQGTSAEALLDRVASATIGAGGSGPAVQGYFMHSKKRVPKEDERIGHELPRVVQQQEGRVTATIQAKGIAVDDDPALEREADELGHRAAMAEVVVGAGESAGDSLSGPLQMAASVVQMGKKKAAAPKGTVPKGAALGLKHTPGMIDKKLPRPTASREPNGSVQHITGEKLDEYLSSADVIKNEVAPEIAAGRVAKGHVFFLKAADFKQLFVSYAMRCRNESTRAAFTEDEALQREPNVHAFRDGTVIFVHQDRGSPSTVLHEGIHLYSDSNYSKQLGHNADEGTTEWLCRLVISDLELNCVRTYYQRQYTAIANLAAKVGADAIKRAYFKGDIQGLKNAVDAAKPRSTFDSWKGYMLAGKYDEANALW